MKKLNKVAKKWVAALRSQKYQQTHNQLGTSDGRRCCLGVLCEIAKQEGVIQKFSIYRIYLPNKVRIWAGLKTSSAKYGPLREEMKQKALWKDNDGVLNGERANFSTIAKIIESMPEGLFRQ